MNCVKCGNCIVDSMNFCPECGEPVSRIRDCKICGFEMDREYKFCPKCGSKVSSLDETNDEEIFETEELLIEAASLLSDSRDLIESDEKEARIRKSFGLVLKAAKLGNIDAAVGAAMLYSMGYNGGEEDNAKESFKWYKKAAACEHPEGLLGLGLCYLTGFGVEKNYGRALKCLERAVELDNSEAMYHLAYCYDRGLGVSEDLSYAKSLYQRAFDEGYTKAAVQLGISYFEDGEYSKAFELLSQYQNDDVDWETIRDRTNYELLSRHRNDDVAGLFYLARCYEDGLGVSKNKVHAESLYQKIVDRGYSEWIRVVGVLHYRKEEYSKAFELLSQYQDDNDIASTHVLALCYGFGHGTDQNVQKAIEILKPLIDFDEDGTMQLELGLLYLAEDKFEDAYRCFKSSAEQENITGIFCMGMALKNGIGVQQDIDKGKKLIQFAAEHGEELAINECNVDEDDECEEYIHPRTSNSSNFLKNAAIVGGGVLLGGIPGGLLGLAATWLIGKSKDQ